MDADLEAIRAKRIAELQSQQQQRLGGSQTGQDEEKAAAALEQRRGILAQIMDGGARERFISTLILGFQGLPWSNQKKLRR